MKKPGLEDLIHPDPWRLWHQKVCKARELLALDVDQAIAFDAWMRELLDWVTLNERRRVAVINLAGAVVSARADVARMLLRRSKESSTQPGTASWFWKTPCRAGGHCRGC